MILPASLTNYELAVKNRYKHIECQLGANDKTQVDDHGNAVITVMSTTDMGNQQIVAHELMHLWLGTRGWNLSERFVVPAVPSMPEGDQQAVDETFATLEEYLEHRMFVPLLRRAGIADTQQEREFLSSEEKREGLTSPFPPPLLAGIYLDISLRDRSVGEQYARFLRSTGRSRALEAARVMNAIIERDDPRTQAQAFKAEQDCLNQIFGVGSPFLDLIP